MSKFECKCGNIMGDSTMEEPHNWRMYPLKNIVDNYVSDEEILEYIDRVKSMPGNFELSIISATQDMVMSSLSDHARSVYICSECNRIWLQNYDGEDYTNNFTSYIPEPY